MATNLYKTQKTMDSCKDHSNKELTLYCKTCKKHICTECVKSGHVDHDCDVLNSVANERRACLPGVCRDIRGNKLPTLNTTLTANPDDDEEEGFPQEVEKKEQLIVEAVKNFAKEKKEKLKKACGISQSGTKEMLTYMDDITKSLDENLHTYSDFDVLKMEEEMMSTLETLESLKVEKEKVAALFLPGYLDHKALEDMIGEVMVLDQVTLNTVDITETHAIESISGFRIRAAKKGRAFIGDMKEDKVMLFNNNGKIIQTMLYRCIDFVVMNNNDHIYTDVDDNAVRVFSSEGSERVVCSTDPLVPIWINKTCDGDILVSMKDDGGRYTVTPSSRRLVQRISMTGDVLTTYEFKKDGKTRLFTYPYSTAENRNGDVCAINQTGEVSGELIILHRDGRVRATYRGQEDSAEPFNPFDVTCDSRCRIIVSDTYNFSVHLLSYDGTFLRYLLSGLSGPPTFLSLCDDSLWLSLGLPDEPWKAKVYRYK